MKQKQKKAIEESRRKEEAVKAKRLKDKSKKKAKAQTKVEVKAPVEKKPPLTPEQRAALQVKWDKDAKFRSAVASANFSTSWRSVFGDLFEKVQEEVNQTWGKN